MPDKEDKSTAFKQVYDDTVYFVDSIVNSYDVFPSILDMMKNGKATVELKKNIFCAR